MRTAKLRIGLSGKMTSGKSLVAQYLVDYYCFVELSFAERLKEIAAELWPRAKYEKDRWLLVQVGEQLRAIDNMVWIRRLLPHIVADRHIVVSDVRFPLEYETLKRLGFTMVRTYVSRHQQLKMVKEMYPDMPSILLDDYSETALDRHVFDYTIDNDAGIPLDDVYKQVRDMIGELAVGVKHD